MGQMGQTRPAKFFSNNEYHLITIRSQGFNELKSQILPFAYQSSFREFYRKQKARSDPDES